MGLFVRTEGQTPLTDAKFYAFRINSVKVLNVPISDFCSLRQICKFVWRSPSVLIPEPNPRLEQPRGGRGCFSSQFEGRQSTTID